METCRCFKCCWHLCYLSTGGETIKGISQQSGARIELQRNPPPNADPNIKMFTVRGSHQQIDYARQLVEEKIGVRLFCQCFQKSFGTVQDPFEWWFDSLCLAVLRVRSHQWEALMGPLAPPAHMVARPHTAPLGLLLPWAPTTRAPTTRDHQGHSEFLYSPTHKRFHTV